MSIAESTINPIISKMLSTLLENIKKTSPLELRENSTKVAQIFAQLSVMNDCLKEVQSSFRSLTFGEVDDEDREYISSLKNQFNSLESYLHNFTEDNVNQVLRSFKNK